MTWDEFVATPSRLSAEAPSREERQTLLDRVASDGFIADYSGVRVSTSGKRFMIKGATVFNLLDDEQVKRGQACVFRISEVEFL